jgi:DNA-binding CsgD family transcriptional regulator
VDLPPQSKGSEVKPYLTPTERRVLDLILAGQVHKQVANSLGITVSTAKFHANRIYAKHGVSGREELIRQKTSTGSRCDWDKLNHVERRLAALSIEHSQAQVAEIMGFSGSKVTSWLRVIYRVLDVKGKAGLAGYMGRNGLLSEAAEVIDIRRLAS